MRAVGFGDQWNTEEMKELLLDVITEGNERACTSYIGETLIATFSKEFAPNIGITVCGIFDKNDKFEYEYYFPFLRGNNITTQEDVSIERHAATESYAGVCEDLRVGVSMIFYLQNMIPYIKAKNSKSLPVSGTTLTLSALSLSGTIMMPIKKTDKDLIRNQETLRDRSQLLNAARNGDERAIENLTMDEIDTYSVVAKRLHKDDVFTLVDTYFMPYGVECDQYSVMGEILEFSFVKNSLTNEEICVMMLSCNDIQFDVCINKADLYGEPAVGRRFKGTVWMQGYINFP